MVKPPNPTKHNKNENKSMGNWFLLTESENSTDDDVDDHQHEPVKNLELVGWHRFFGATVCLAIVTLIIVGVSEGWFSSNQKM